MLVPSKYKLSLPLPYPVLPDDGAAKFVKEKRTLKLTLPVKALSKDEIAEIKAELEKEAAKRASTISSTDNGDDRSSLVEEVTPAPGATADNDAKAAPAAASKEKDSKEETKDTDAADNKDKKEEMGDVEAQEKADAAWAAWGASKDAEEKRFEEERSMREAAEANAAAEAAAVASAHTEEKAAENLVKLVDDGTGFIPSSSWRGRQNGMVFKTGPKGLGYYKDAGSERPASAGAGSTAAGSGSGSARRTGPASFHKARAGKSGKNDSGSSGSTTAAAATAASKPKTQTTSIVCPPFTFTQDGDMGKVHVEVGNIDDASVRFFPLPNEVKVKFASKKDGTKYELCLDFDEANGEVALPLRCSYELCEGKMIVRIKKSSDKEWIMPVVRGADAERGKKAEVAAEASGKGSTKGTAKPKVGRTSAVQSKDIVFELD